MRNILIISAIIFSALIPSANAMFLTGGTTAGSDIPTNAYVAEDGATAYVAEDGTTYYVQE